MKVNAMQRFWLPAFAFSAWLSSNVLAFFVFDIRLDVNSSDSAYVAGWCGVGSATLYALILMAPKLYQRLTKPRFWFLTAIIQLIVLLLMSQAYFDLRKEWTCEYYNTGLMIVVGIHNQETCGHLVERIAGDFAAYFSDQRELTRERFRLLAAAYTAIWLLFSAMLLAVFHASKFARMPARAARRATSRSSSSEVAK
ncbi:hypothetical protein [Rhodoferax sp.]|uniref:hypothetical protein n=1 Tax=Rhodoferax sp. TaxID=50421 RepID=UPI003784523A